MPYCTRVGALPIYYSVPLKHKLNTENHRCRARSFSKQSVCFAGNGECSRDPASKTYLAAIAGAIPVFVLRDYYQVGPRELIPHLQRRSWFRPFFLSEIEFFFRKNRVVCLLL